MTAGGFVPGPRRDRLLGLFALLVSLFALAPRSAAAEEPSDGKKVPPRAAAFEWDGEKKELFVTLKFRDLIDDEIQRKLSRGLPTTIVFTGALYRRGARATPVATTVQSCKITWLVWDELYRVEITGPEGNRTRTTSTLEGVLRRCAEVKRLLVATSRELPMGIAVSLRARVQVNPVSPEILEKIKMWVSRPARTGTAAPGDALFSTFTGLFMQRISDAERTGDIVTVEAVPTVMEAAVGEG